MSRGILAKTIAKIVLQHPFWCEVLYSMQTIVVASENKEVQTAATDGKTLWVNSGFFERLNSDERVTLIVHELCHKILLHCSRRGDRDPSIWNIAADHAVNNLLVGNGFVTIRQEIIRGFCDRKYKNCSAEAIYGDLIRSGEVVEMPKELQDVRDIKGDKFVFEQDVRELIVSAAGKYGKTPLGIEMGATYASIIKKGFWYDELHRYMKGLSKGEYNSAKMNRRSLRSHGYFSPLLLTEALQEVVIMIDTSGSCFSKRQQKEFCAQVNSIFEETKPAVTRTYYFDTEIYEGSIQDFGDFEFISKPKGGGGTDFRCIFSFLEHEEMHPEIVVIFTDLCGSFPDILPEFPVIWVSTQEGEVPFGEVLYIEESLK